MKSNDVLLIVFAFVLFVLAAAFFGWQRRVAETLMAAGLALLTWATWIK